MKCGLKLTMIAARVCYLYAGVRGARDPVDLYSGTDSLSGRQLEMRVKQQHRI